ncbi:MAG: cytochrome c family protein [Rhodospirillales bacterium]|nr:cytochrome c family protein [Rhodospirillales bacterium]
MISLAIAFGVVVVVNVIGELSIRPRTEIANPEPKQAVPEAKAPEAEPSVPVTKPSVSEAKAAPDGLASLLAAYTPEAGSKAFRKCKSCHTSEKGGANRVGPNLWGVLGRDKGAVEGFKYSDAMKLKGGNWTYADLDHFLTNPRTFVRGTKMSIKGFSDPALRVSLIGFLRTLSDDPKPLPE